MWIKLQVIHSLSPLHTYTHALSPTNPKKKEFEIIGKVYIRSCACRLTYIQYLDVTYRGNTLHNIGDSHGVVLHYSRLSSSYIHDLYSIIHASMCAPDMRF